ncbi:WhiB family transcriptional regulator (plasmid) [Rhodococcus opacus]|uniref:Transcriptional regulator WhiB n=1 Tax=Rhodococcus opacus M213 TaxID=1129896 RepID=K8X9H2_RHOOP|nr:WhiB family transcriptional regulator [Rhodococcus opacus]EKT77461.1 WhiB family transcriptional regulator [Rhodococcus opacus M213]WKN59925.1 WhiB family transcriptional regulator [Rhodococcus opacus]
MPDQFHHPLDGDWQHRASCRGTDTDLFFSPDGERGNVRARRERAAKQICQGCPVLDDCRAYALTATEPYGIWGGMSETERARHTRRTRRPARPRECVASTDPLTWRIRTPRA